MPSQIRPTRLEVSDRFPMLGFTIRTDDDCKTYEVAVAADPSLFRPDAKARRTRSTFFSSRSSGPLAAGRGESVYVVPPEVLARFVGQEKLFFGLVTYGAAKGSGETSTFPAADGPYVSLKGLSGRSLQRVRMIPNRQRGSTTYQNGGSDLEWGGDVIQPGTQPVSAPGAASGAPTNGTKSSTNGASVSANGASTSANGKPAGAAPAGAAALEYNDGFGPLPAPKTALRGVPATKTTTRAPSRARALEGDEPPSEETVALLRELSEQPDAKATALVFDADDVEDAKKFAPHWKELIRYQTPAAVVSAIEARNMSVQRIEDAIGDLNLDFYPICISTLPTIDGVSVDGPTFLRHLRLHVDDFVDTSQAEFTPYESGRDDLSWASSSPAGSVMYIHILPDNAAVVGSVVNEKSWRFTTVRTPRSGEHPVSGHREFGFFQDKNGDHIFYSKGADRTTGALETAADLLTFRGGDELWKSFQDKVLAFVESHGGKATKPLRFSKRFKWSVVNIILSPESSGFALGMRKLPVATSKALALTPINVADAKPVKLPAARPASDIEAALIEAGIALFFGPMAPMVALLREAAKVRGLSVAVGPAASVGFVLGMGAGVGLIFTADGKIGIYGKFEVSGGLLDSIEAGLQVTIIRGGIAEFNDVGFAIGGAFVEGVAVTLQVLLGGAKIFRGVSATVGVGLAPEPFEWFASVEGSLSDQLAGAEGLGAAPDEDLVLPPPPAPIKRAEPLGAGVEIASAVVGAVMERIIAGEGSITWELDQLRGLKHPNDVAPSPLPPFQDAKSIRLNEWPYVEALDGDQISAWFSIDWQYNGSSLGNVRISNVGTNGALLRKLQVSARIMDDNIVYPRTAPKFAALRIRFYYRFTRAIGSDDIAIQDLQLFGDGTYESSGRWEQT